MFANTLILQIVDDQNMHLDEVEISLPEDHFCQIEHKAMNEKAEVDQVSVYFDPADYQCVATHMVEWEKKFVIPENLFSYSFSSSRFNYSFPFFFGKSYRNQNDGQKSVLTDAFSDLIIKN